ncbi:MAG: hypothetical protein IPM12_12900 [Flavobacteriales bacterium]|nr:hypothetical protein [Flavobacteriales bacterium]
MPQTLTSIASLRFGVHAKGLDKGPMALVQSSAITAEGTIENAYVSRTSPELVTYKDVDLLREGDVLLIGKGSTNVAAVWQGGDEDAVASSMLYVIRPDTTRVLPGYLAGYLNSRPAQAQMAAYRKVGTVAVLDRSALDQLLVPVPSIEEQQKLVRLADAAQRTRLHLTELSNAYAQLLDAVWATYPKP